MQTILVVENNVLVGKLLATYLRRLGYTVLVAVSAEAAMRVTHAHKGDIHLLLTNVFLPGGMNGWQLAQHLRIARPDMETMFISSSGYHDLLNHGIDVPANRFLRKPFPLSEFSDVIRTLLPPHTPPSLPNRA